MSQQEGLRALRALYSRSEREVLYRWTYKTQNVVGLLPLFSAVWLVMLMSLVITLGLSSHSKVLELRMQKLQLLKHLERGPC